MEKHIEIVSVSKEAVIFLPNNLSLPLGLVG